MTLSMPVRQRSISDLTPTADSLHIGHFMALNLMRRLQLAGNRPIALLGGGTTMVGDPSGRTDMRQMLTQEQIQANAEKFKVQMSKFIDFSEGKALMLDNAEWLLKLNYIELLRDVGACFSVNNMLRAECYKQRMETRTELPRVQLYDHAELRLLPHVPEVRLRDAVRRRRPVVQHTRRHASSSAASSARALTA